MRYARALPLVLAGCAAAAGARATPAQRDDRMNGYLATWSRDADITPAVVSRLYAREVDYYGHRMTVGGVYRDKLAFVRRWPERRYRVVPGSVSNDCATGVDRCRVGAVLHWTRGDRAGTVESGTNSLRLDLAREDGALKIVRESGEPLGRR